MAIKQKCVAILIAPKNFRDEEYFQPKVMLDAVGIKVFTVAKGDPDEVTGIKGGKAHIDAKLDEIDPLNYDGLVLVGGKGVKSYYANKKIHKLLQKMNDAGKVVAAICIAPIVLAKAGILRDHKATVNSEEGILALKENGAEYEDKSLVIDHNIITAKDFSVAMSFGESIAKKVKSL